MSLVVGDYSEMDHGGQEDIDKFNDETFGSGTEAVDSDWESPHLLPVGRLPGGEDIVHALQEDSERDGHGNRTNPLTPMQGGPAFAVLNNGRSSQATDIPTDIFEKLNISDLEELWSNSPKQSSMLSDPVWSSPELPTNLRTPQESTSPVPPKPKLISVEELEREMMRESASPSPSQSPSPPVTVPSSHQPPPTPPQQQQQQQQQQPPTQQHGVAVHPLLPFPPSTAAASHMRPMYPPGFPVVHHRHMVPHPMGPQHMMGHGMVRPGLPFPMPPRLPPNVPLMGPPRMMPPYGMFPHPAHMPPHMAHRMPHPHYGHHRGPHPIPPQYPFPPYHYQQQLQQQQQLRPHHPPSKLSEMLGELRPDGSGFMNQKEKEWVVKVQLMQLHSGDPEVDDYYYQNFVQKQAAKASKGEGVVVASDKPLPLSLPPAVSKEERQSRSKAVEFEGTLGKVSVSSVSAPRQSINISSSTDTTTSSSKVGGVTDGKKEGVSRRKLVLIAVEEIYDLVMELESLEHHTITLDRNEAALALARKKKICSRIFTLTRVKSNFSDSPSTREREVFFQNMLQLRKGKRSFQRFLPFLSDDQAKALLFAMCKNLSSIVKKDMSDQVLTDCIPAVLAVLKDLKMEDVSLFMSVLRPLCGKLQENKLFVAMMIALVKRGTDLSSSASELPDNVLSDWFSETKQVHSTVVSCSSSLSSNKVLVDLLEALPHINR